MNGAAQFATGATLSSTVTVEVHVLVFPVLSVTVKVTVFGPTLAHVKEAISIDKVTGPSGSKDPPSTSEGRIATFPVASNCTVISIQIAVGVESTTNTTSFPSPPS